MEATRQSPLHIALAMLPVALVPALVFGLAGWALDTRFGSAPWATLACLFVALHVSLVWAMVRARRILSEIEIHSSS